jgi:CHAT domain-containing protein
LYKVFWEPIQQHLKPYNKVFFSPDGVFNQLNLLTLQNPKTKKYLIEELNLVNITSTKDLLTRNTFTSINKFDSESDAVLIGFPNYHYVTQSDSNQNFGVDTEPIQTNKIGYDFSELPETKVEIANIENLLKNYKVKTKVLLGNSALEDSLKILRNPKILHIATHGFFLPETVLNNYTENNGFDILGTDIKVSQENPLLRSGLLFTGASGVLSNSTNDNSTDDGILTAFEAQNLILDRTELVVLSACETGSGELRNGEGVYGLQRAFKVAGARYLIMSLWKVDDKATQLMMSNFYQNWLNSKDIHESFRNAQNFIRKKYSSPYFWGAFVLVGV